MARLPVNSLNSAPRNYIINGNFDFWQRATTLGTSTGNRYCADRWQCTSTGTTYSTDRIAFTVGQTAVPNEPTYNHQIAVNSVAGASNLAILAYNIEDVRTLAGQNATITFWAKSSVARNVAVELEQNFGTGGSPSANVNAIGVTTLALTTTYTKFNVTVAIPSISGKTIGTDAASSYLRINIWFDAGSNFNSRTNSLGQPGSAVYNFASVSLIAGLSPPERFFLAGGNIQGELAACQRYYEKSYRLDTAPAAITGTDAANGIASSSGELDLSWDYRVSKRTGASVTLYSPVTGAINRADSGGDKVIGVSGAFAWGFYLNSGGVVSASNNYSFHWTADADY